MASALANEAGAATAVQGAALMTTGSAAEVVIALDTVTALAFVVGAQLEVTSAADLSGAAIIAFAVAAEAVSAVDTSSATIQRATIQDPDFNLACIYGLTDLPCVYELAQISALYQLTSIPCEWSDQ